MMDNPFEKDPDYRDVETLNDLELLLRKNILECQRLSKVLGRKDMVQFGEAYERLLRLKLDYENDLVMHKKTQGLH